MSEMTLTKRRVLDSGECVQTYDFDVGGRVERWFLDGTEVYLDDKNVVTGSAANDGRYLGVTIIDEFGIVTVRCPAAHAFAFRSRYPYGLPNVCALLGGRLYRGVVPTFAVNWPCL